MNEVEKAKNLLTGENCYECNFYYNFTCRIELDSSELPEELVCPRFLPKENIDAEEILKKQIGTAINKDIDKWFIKGVK